MKKVFIRYLAFALVLFLFPGCSHVKRESATVPGATERTAPETEAIIPDTEVTISKPEPVPVHEATERTVPEIETIIPETESTISKPEPVSVPGTTERTVLEPEAIIPDTESITSKPETKGNDWDAVKSKFEKILSGSDVFFNIDQCKGMTLESYCTADTGMNLKITKYALADLDGDSVPELVLWLTINGYNDYGFLVIRYDGNGGAAGYSFTYRQLIDLKKDGTFGYSGGVADSGYAKLIFNENVWQYHKLGSIEENGENAATFFWNGQTVSQDVFWSYAEKQDAKECVEWMQYPSSNYNLSFS